MGARVDVAFRVGGQQHYVDVTIRQPRCQKYVRQAAAAASIAEEEKRTRYPAVSDAGLLSVMPSAVES